MEYGIGIGIGLVIGLAIGFLVAKSMATKPFGNAAGLALGKKVALKAAGDAEFAKKLEHLFNPPVPKPSGEPIRLLGLLQRDARLLDFLMENIGPYTDDQIGASVRDIHAKSQTVLKKHLTLESVMSQPEGASVTVPAGFDPSAVRLVGNVTGQPPFKGTLQHAGWKVKNMNIPKTPDGQDEFVLMPAEVEI
ncbi:DUF2760 domain-containing protein [Zavarzinella formosa]|uniref:DUF2760 domain-containing protein n=1 Tax=Zavarzinella formosa TaxID=360055 RepID=UPI00031CD96E|nr:DUF2760 domain-containing protein [Zavarzinella formosa]